MTAEELSYQRKGFGGGLGLDDRARQSGMGEGPLTGDYKMARFALTEPYSPGGQGRLPPRGALQTVAERYGVTAYQVALAWVTRSPGVIAIPKASDVGHVRENRAAAELQLMPGDLNHIDAAYPPPARKTRRAML